MSNGISTLQSSTITVQVAAMFVCRVVPLTIWLPPCKSDSDKGRIPIVQMGHNAKNEKRFEEALDQKVEKPYVFVPSIVEGIS